MPDVCTSCFEVEYWNRSRFKQFWAPLHVWFGTRTLWSGTWGGGGGVNLIAPKIEFLRFCARIAFLARAKFLRQPLVTYKTFGKNRFFRMFLICPKNALVTFGVYPPPPPPLLVLDSFVLAREVWQNTRIYFLQSNSTDNNDELKNLKIHWKWRNYLNSRAKMPPDPPPPNFCWNQKLKGGRFTSLIEVFVFFCHFSRNFPLFFSSIICVMCAAHYHIDYFKAEPTTFFNDFQL